MITHHLKTGHTRFIVGRRSADFLNPQNLTDDDLLQQLREQAKTDRATLEEYAAAHGLDPFAPSTGRQYRHVHTTTRRLRTLLGGQL